MKKLLFALSLVLFFAASALAQKPSTTKAPVAVPGIDTLKVLQAEKEALLKISKEIDEKHAKLIERGDKVHDISATWISAGVGMLGVLFAIGAIVAGWLIYNQGRKYEGNLNEGLIRLDNSYKKQYEEHVANLKLLREPFEVAIKLANQLQNERSGKSEDKADAEFAETISALEVLKSEIDNMVSKSSAEKRDLYNMLYFNKRVGADTGPIFKISCSFCDNTSLITGDEGLIYAFNGGRGKICPSCHRIGGVKTERLPD